MDRPSWSDRRFEQGICSRTSHFVPEQRSLHNGGPHTGTPGAPNDQTFPRSFGCRPDLVIEETLTANHPAKLARSPQPRRHATIEGLSAAAGRPRSRDPATRGRARTSPLLHDHARSSANSATQSHSTPARIAGHAHPVPDISRLIIPATCRTAITTIFPSDPEGGEPENGPHTDRITRGDRRPLPSSCESPAYQNYRTNSPHDCEIAR